jgi:hypothetical protein
LDHSNSVLSRALKLYVNKLRFFRITGTDPERFSDRKVASVMAHCQAFKRLRQSRSEVNALAATEGEDVQPPELLIGWKIALEVGPRFPLSRVTVPVKSGLSLTSQVVRF